jgi:hypothetical protein
MEYVPSGRNIKYSTNTLKLRAKITGSPLGKVIVLGLSAFALYKIALKNIIMLTNTKVYITNVGEKRFFWARCINENGDLSD